MNNNTYSTAVKLNVGPTLESHDHNGDVILHRIVSNLEHKHPQWCW